MFQEGHAIREGLAINVVEVVTDAHPQISALMS